MSPQRTISEELATKLTCTTEQGLDGMIRNIPPAQPSTINRVSLHSSLGKLDMLPAELLLMTLNLLDFQSVSRMSRVSLRGKAVVEGLPAYKDMMEHAPSALTALGRTRLLSYHSISLLRHTLRSDKCASCFDFGGFLFLPTCERVCFECLRQNRAFRLTTLTTAKRCFYLTDKELQRIPIMHSIPGMYDVGFPISRRRVHRLVSVKQAKKLGIEVHGSVENLANLMPKAPGGRMTLRMFWIFTSFHEAPLEPPGCDLSRQPEKSNSVQDDFGGMASIRFPYIKKAGQEHGRACRGCQITYAHYREGLLPATGSVLSELAPPDVPPRGPLLAMIKRLRSAQGFLEHIQHCYGIRRLLEELGEDYLDEA